AASEDELIARLQRLVFQAFVGTRLPVTSWESPLPAFQLGQCAYVPGARAPQRADAESSVRRVEDIIAAIDLPGKLPRQSLAGDAQLVARAKGLEAALRASLPDDVPHLAGVLVETLSSSDRRGPLPVQIRSLFAALFHHVALTPYTQLADNLVGLLAILARMPDVGAATVIDVISYMLRHLVRHLTA